MAHRSGIVRIVIDVAAADHDHALAFWQGVVGHPMARVERFPEYHGTMLGMTGVGLLVQRLGDGASRMHLDIHADDVGAEVARLEQLGAAVVAQHDRWTVMRDPAGLVFCVVADDRLDDTNSRFWE